MLWYQRKVLGDIKAKFFVVSVATNRVGIVIKLRLGGHGVE
jgi:hypothetical protein